MYVIVCQKVNVCFVLVCIAGSSASVGGAVTAGDDGGGNTALIIGLSIGLGVTAGLVVVVVVIIGGIVVSVLRRRRRVNLTKRLEGGA